MADTPNPLGVQMMCLPQAQKSEFVKTRFFVCCEHGRREAKNPTEYAVVADWQKGKDSISIEEARDFTINVVDSDTPPTIQPTPGARRKQTIVCETLKPVDGFFLGKLKFWDGLNKPREYRATINDKEGARQLRIKSYCPDQYSLRVKFPTLMSFSRGSKYGVKPGDLGRVVTGKTVAKTREKTSTDITWSPLSGNQTTRKSETKSTRTGSKEKITYSKPPEKVKESHVGPVTLTCNAIEVKIDVVEFIGSVMKLANELMGMYKKVKGDIPQVGWYVDMNFQVMQGAFALDFGWREFEDHRAFMYMGVGVDIELVEASVEIGIGVSGFGFKLQVFGRIEGSIRVKALVSRQDPDTPVSLEMPIDGSIEGVLGARFEVRYLVELSGELTTAIQLKDASATFSVQMGVNMKGQFWWTGIKASARASVGAEFGAEAELGKMTWKPETSTTLVEKSKLGEEWEWPGVVSIHEDEIPPTRIREILRAGITKGIDVQIVDITASGEEAWPVDDVVHSIESRINVHRQMKRDEETIDLLSCQIRQELDSMSVRRHALAMHKTVDSRQFYDFLFGIRFKQILSQYDDPIKAAMLSSGIAV